MIPISTERQIIEDLAAGMSIRAIAAKRGIHRDTVARVLRAPRPDIDRPTLDRRERAEIAYYRAKAAAALTQCSQLASEEQDDDSGCELDLESDEADIYLAEAENKERRRAEETPGRDNRPSMRAENVVSETVFHLRPTHDVEIWNMASDASGTWYPRPRKRQKKVR